ncbi:hypothetical protein ABT030_51525 [Streptomyces mirabilis]|uniref:hypothetical protein n=1 Tax=Streptomyces mirabilis TaxID=68239 RepID=UPI00333260EB
MEELLRDLESLDAEGFAFSGESGTDLMSIGMGGESADEVTIGRRCLCCQA